MRTLTALILAAAVSPSLNAQCNFLNIAVSASDSGYVQLYHPGFFMFGSTTSTGGFDNQCHWTVTTLDGAAVFDTLTTGAWADQSFVLFHHGLTINDSMLVELILTHPDEPMDCCMADTLIWVEDDFFNFGNWETASLNVGTDCLASVGVTEANGFSGITIFPQPAGASCRVRVPSTAVRLFIAGADGRPVLEFSPMAEEADYPLDGLTPGMYFITAWDATGRLIGVERLLKADR